MFVAMCNALGLIVLRSFWINLKLSIFFCLHTVIIAASSYALQVAVFYHLNANFLHPSLNVPLRHIDRNVLPLIKPLFVEILLGLLHKFPFTLLYRRIEISFQMCSCISMKGYVRSSHIS